MVKQIALLQLPKKRQLNKIFLIFRDTGHALFFKTEDHGCAALQLKDSFPIYILSSKLESHQGLLGEKKKKKEGTKDIRKGNKNKTGELINLLQASASGHLYNTSDCCPAVERSSAALCIPLVSAELPYH